MSDETGLRTFCLYWEGGNDVAAAMRACEQIAMNEAQIADSDALKRIAVRIANRIAAMRDAALASPPEPTEKEALWQEILEKVDRTSPAEYPDMALITRAEFFSAIDAALRSSQQPGANGGGNFVVEYTIKIDRDGNVHNDTVTNGSSFAEVYKAFHAIKAEVERQIIARRECPFNPINPQPPVFDDSAAPPHPDPAEEIARLREALEAVEPVHDSEGNLALETVGMSVAAWTEKRDAALGRGERK